MKHLILLMNNVSKVVMQYVIIQVCYNTLQWNNKHYVNKKHWIAIEIQASIVYQLITAIHDFGHIHIVLFVVCTNWEFSKKPFCLWYLRTIQSVHSFLRQVTIEMTANEPFHIMLQATNISWRFWGKSENQGQII